MNIRMKFKKYGVMKFVGHLDMMRYFQKALRRAGIPVAYSKGYSPHQLMSFAAPLGVGITSDGEYMDIVIEDGAGISSQEAVRLLNAQMADGVEIVNMKQLPENTKSAMALLQAASYRVDLKEIPVPDLNAVMTDFMQQEQILITKKTKKSEKEVDLRPFIYEWKAEGNSVFLKVAASSADNVNPKLVMEALYGFIGQEWSPDLAAVHRFEMFAEKDGKLAAMEDLGEDIE